MELIKRCISDSLYYARECLGWLIWTVVIVAIARLLLAWWKGKKGRNPLLASLLLWEIDSIYIVYTLYVTLGMRRVGIRREVELLPFLAVLERPEELPLMVENILLFIPFGFLLPLTFPRLSSGRRVFLLAGAVSLVIEVLQYLFRCGKTELDDVIFNILGAGIGWLLSSLFCWVMGKRKTGSTPPPVQFL